ncbi:helix-turn-helix transcriptional regulator [Catenulispora sp. NF23]|uniref:helix-turn-helix domain-containing protein n=1 Tax=Catenulispora pinistramenti TaxID=2705254 RepID=UPI001BABC8E2|nr:helix-turn-helix transcriptional regulator [Catenulispora pinistramenti]MBS2537093.1 helix-turn-helix transcriptional regulator [Catenulispora pinistramenti]
MLDTLGVGTRAQTVYAAMQHQPRADVETLAALVSLTEGQVREALDELVTLELLRASREHDGEFVPVPLAIALPTLVRRQEEELAARQRTIAESRTAAARLIAEQVAPRPGAQQASGSPAATEHLLGADAIQMRLDALVAGATTEVMSLVPGNKVPEDSLKAAKAADTVTLGRGVACRIVYQDAIRNHPSTLAYSLWLAEHGAQVRTTAVGPQRLLIADRVAAIVPIDPDNPWGGRVYTTDAGIIAQLIALFEQIWAGAAPLDAPRTIEVATGLTSTERAILQLLAAGATDEAVAKKLGVSGRTVRRIMADLMDRLKAESRFEAGIKAAKNGWL